MYLWQGDLGSNQARRVWNPQRSQSSPFSNWCRIKESNPVRRFTKPQHRQLCLSGLVPQERFELSINGF